MNNKPCPECEHQEYHKPISERYARNNRFMSVTCSACGWQFTKPAEVSEEMDA